MVSFSPRFVLFLMLATLALFLFPAASGSFTATHGPTTALRAATFVRNLFATLAILIALVRQSLSSGQAIPGEPQSQAASTTFPIAQLRC